MIHFSLIIIAESNIKPRSHACSSLGSSPATAYSDAEGTLRNGHAVTGEPLKWVNCRLCELCSDVLDCGYPAWMDSIKKLILHIESTPAHMMQFSERRDGVIDAMLRESRGLVGAAAKV